MVKKLVSQVLLSGGSHSVFWDGRNNKGKEVSAGVYLYQLKVGDKQFMRRMLLMK